MGLFRRLKDLLSVGPDEASHRLPDPSLQDAEIVPMEGPRLNIGCGWDYREGWVNVDMHERHNPDVVADATRLVAFEDDHFAYVLAQDILEHVHRDRVMTALGEWNRVLLLDGLLEVRTTDVIAIATLMQHPDRATPEQHELLLRCMFGSQGYEGDYHLSGFTVIWLRHALCKAGFEVVKLCHKDQWLLEVIARKVAHRPPDQLLSLQTDAEFLDAAYLKVLNRAPDDGGRDYWLDQLRTGTPREVVLSSLAESEEAGKPKDAMNCQEC